MGPRFPTPIRTRAQVDALTESFQSSTSRSRWRRFVRSDASPKSPSWASRAVRSPGLLPRAGIGLEEWIETKKMIWQDPETFQALLDKLADAVGAHLQAQAAAGAAGVELFDTWAGAVARGLRPVRPSRSTTPSRTWRMRSHVLHAGHGTVPAHAEGHRTACHRLAEDSASPEGSQRGVILQGNLDPIA